MQSHAVSNTEVEDNRSKSSATRYFFPDKPWRAVLLALLVFATIAVSTLFLFRHFGNKNTRQSATSLPPSREPGTIRLKGTTEAVRMRAISVPRLEGERMSTLTLTKLLASGTRVKQGQVLAEFDRQAELRLALDKQAEYEKLANQLLEEQAKEDAARAKDETEIRQAESALSKAELEMQKVELLSHIDGEKAQQTLDEAKATLQQLRETF